MEDLLHDTDVIDASAGISLLEPEDHHHGHDHGEEESHEGHHHEEDVEHLHTNRYEEAFEKFPVAGTIEQVKEKVKNLLEKHEKENFTPEVLKQIHGFIDLTSLTSIDTKESICKLVENVNDFDF